MFELRYLEIPAGSKRIYEHPSATFVDRQQHSVYRVLQYRALVGHQANADGWNVPIWTDWRDVPTVTEQESA